MKCPLTHKDCTGARDFGKGLVCQVQALTVIGAPYFIKDMKKCPKKEGSK